MTLNTHFDVAVIGGGPAGMMAAGRAGECGARVVLIEKNHTLGKKLLVTGNERCNILNNEPSLDTLIEKYGKNGRFLYSVFYQFGVDDTLSFFSTRGLATKQEQNKRVFPVSDKAADVLQVMKHYLQENTVTVLCGKAVRGIQIQENKIVGLTVDTQQIRADRYIVATGGLSYKTTGSTGDGYQWAKEVGHTIAPLRPSLVPLISSDPWLRALQGLSLSDTHLSIFLDGKKKSEYVGEVLFTHKGMSGPIILVMSKEIGALLHKGSVEIQIDFMPNITLQALDSLLQQEFNANKKLLKNYLETLLPKRIVPIVLKLHNIDPSKQCLMITREDRKLLVAAIKGFSVHMDTLDSFEYAVITTGGVDLREIDAKTMRSKMCTNLYFAGEVVDLDGPTGGFNLQICWSTGFVAGEHAAQHTIK